jgi:hypothetical protein
MHACVSPLTSCTPLRTHSYTRPPEPFSRIHPRTCTHSSTCPHVTQSHILSPTRLHPPTHPRACAHPPMYVPTGRYGPDPPHGDVVFSSGDPDQDAAGNSAEMERYAGDFDQTMPTCVSVSVFNTHTHTHTHTNSLHSLSFAHWRLYWNPRCPLLRSTHPLLCICIYDHDVPITAVMLTSLLPYFAAHATGCLPSLPAPRRFELCPRAFCWWAMQSSC